jgi:mRNA-degrading endonuclease RelE of RelBE toxin-antitoxin system
MANKYTIRYTATFIKQFNNISKYIIYKLQNRIAAESFYYEVINEIEKRRENPESFEKYKSRRKRKNTYYKINVKNYTIFYVVQNNTMEIRRILYSRRNLDNLI